MWTLNGRTRASHTARSRQVGVAVALLACIGLAACTAAETPIPASTADDVSANRCRRAASSTPVRIL